MSQAQSTTKGPATNVAAVRIEGLLKQYGNFAALRGITAEFAAAKLYAIVGNNGAGKTTLLRSLAGLSRPTRGSIAIFGNSDLRAVCAEIGYMAHPSLLYDELSGMENLRYFARLYGIEPDGPTERVCADTIRSVNLDPSLNRPVGQYSQGMRQRMSLARALLNDPKLLLLDEPFSNVDIHAANQMVELLRTMPGRGKTLFVVTHQGTLLDGVADEFVTMDAGQVASRTQRLHSAKKTPQ